AAALADATSDGAPLRLPTARAAGGTLALTVPIRNASGATWPVGDVARIELRALLRPEDAFAQLDPTAVAPDAVAPLPRDVAPGEIVDLPMQLPLPDAPGRYRLWIDLVLPDVDWFHRRLGAPLVDTVLQLTPTDAQADDDAATGSAAPRAPSP
ncbi:MAG: hypothetical protein AAF772_17375, partial [Acidobacteriota bacterium]